MKATINVSLRIPMGQARLLRRAAEARGIKLATYIREAALYMALEAERATTAKAIAKASI